MTNFIINSSWPKCQFSVLDNTLGQNGQNLQRKFIVLIELKLILMPTNNVDKQYKDLTDITKLDTDKFILRYY
jgi:hypothetical protein